MLMKLLDEVLKEGIEERVRRSGSERLSVCEKVS